MGTGSLCEILDFRLTSDTELVTLPERMNAVMPEGIHVIEAYEPQRKASELKWLDTKGVFEYDERDKTAMAAALKEFFERDAIVITKKTKRGMGEAVVMVRLDNTLDINGWDLSSLSSTDYAIYSTPITITVK